MSETRGFTVMDPDSLYHGKSYSDWVCDWFNWYLSADADKHNLGPVVFLRSLGLPNKLTGSGISDVFGQIQNSSVLPGSQIDPSYQKAYVNDPNIRVGADRLQIYEDQAVLVPIIVAYQLATSPGQDFASLQEFTGLTIDYGDNPPFQDQLTVDHLGLELSPEKMLDFRIVTPIFTALVPDTDFGRSVKDFLEVHVSPGTYPAMVEGYFVLLKFNARDAPYWVNAWATGPRELGGTYSSDLIYEIEVEQRSRDLTKRVSRRKPSRNELIRHRTFYLKFKNGELTDAEITEFKKLLRPGSRGTRF